MLDTCLKLNHNACIEPIMQKMSNESSLVDLSTFLYALQNISPAISELLMNNLFFKGAFDNTIEVPIQGTIKNDFLFSKYRRINKYMVEECMNTKASIEKRTTVDIRTFCVKMNHLSGSTESLEVLRRISEAPNENLET